MLFKHGDKVLISLDEEDLWTDNALSFDKKEITIDKFAGYWSDELGKMIQDKRSDHYAVEAYWIVEDNHTCFWTLDDFAPRISDLL